MAALARWEAARRALADCRRVDEAKTIRDTAEAMRVYARQARDLQLEIDAATIRVRAERRLGELLRAAKDAGQIGRGQPPKKCAETKQFPRVTLDAVGIDRKLSSRAQKVAGIAEQAFEAMVERMRADMARRGARVALDLSRDQAVADRQAAHAARTLRGGTVDDLHRLAASGFRAGAILADPAWRFVTRSARGEGRSASAHYTTDDFAAMATLPVAALAADDCLLVMWIVDWAPRLALDLIEAWGFVHKTCAFTWVKQSETGEAWHFGQGYWTRANPEQAWLATRGAPRRRDAGVAQLIVAPVMEHSRKPDAVHDRIGRLVDGPYLELFARRERPGWLTWGDELAFREPERNAATTTGPAPFDPETGEVVEPEADGAPAEPRVTSRDPVDAADPLDIPDFLRRRPDGQAPFMRAPTEAGRAVS
ncbi:MT-A70 family methyltransferase [Rhodoplanes sp. SY1]|uniref:MT-A70 family methyltransferase n=1 Tax=Rhodoplanes sp. SY1 TaxID=3166646 RepID=UPI0038B607B6